MPSNQSINESTFFINENNQHVLNILKTVLAIPAEYAYTMKPDGLDSNFFMIYDSDKTAYTSFSVEYNEPVRKLYQSTFGDSEPIKEFYLSMGCRIFPFEGYDINNYEYMCTVILDKDLNYLRTEVCFRTQQENDDMLIFIESKGQIKANFINWSSPAFFEYFILTSKNFMTDSFNYETFFLTDLYVSNPSIFRTYSIADLFNARTDTILLNDMKQISDMATI